MNPKPNLVFLNRSFDKKRLKALLLWFRLNLSEGAALRAVESLQRLGFRSATQGAISLGLDDLKTPASKGGRVFQAQLEVALAHHEHHRGNRTPVELFQHLVDTWHRTSQDLTAEVVQLFHSTERVNPVYMMAFSGARGNLSQVRQLVGMRGLMADPRGQIVGFPILSNFREGLTITEYFVSCYGARKGVVDTAIRTADAGYLTRRLADVSHHVVVRTTNCGTHRSIRLRDIKEGQKIILPLASRLVGRVLAEQLPHLAHRNQEITPDLASKIASQHLEVAVRSPLSCSLRLGVCQLCYGWGLSEGRQVTLGEAVGIIAAQSIGEPGTQLTLRTFHTGGVFSGDLLNEIRAPYGGIISFPEPLQGLLVRTPHGQIAFLTKVSGKMVISPVDLSNLPVESQVNPDESSVNLHNKVLFPREDDLSVSSASTLSKLEAALEAALLPSKTGLTNGFDKAIASTKSMRKTGQDGVTLNPLKGQGDEGVNGQEGLPPEAEGGLPPGSRSEAPGFIDKVDKVDRDVNDNFIVDRVDRQASTSLAGDRRHSYRDPRTHHKNNFEGEALDENEFFLQPSTVIFARHQEYVSSNQLLAEFSSSSFQSTKNQIEVTQQVLSETAGQVWFKEVHSGNRKGPGSGSLGTLFSSQNLGTLWVLAGKPRTENTGNNRQLFLSFNCTLRGDKRLDEVHQKTGNFAVSRVDSDAFFAEKGSTKFSYGRKKTQYYLTKQEKTFPTSLHHDFQNIKYHYSLGYSQSISFISTEFIYQRTPLVNLTESTKAVSHSNFHSYHSGGNVLKRTVDSVQLVLGMPLPSTCRNTVTFSPPSAGALPLATYGPNLAFPRESTHSDLRFRRVDSFDEVDAKGKTGRQRSLSYSTYDDNEVVDKSGRQSIPRDQVVRQSRQHRERELPGGRNINSWTDERTSMSTRKLWRDKFQGIWCLPTQCKTATAGMLLDDSFFSTEDKAQGELFWLFICTDKKLQLLGTKTILTGNWSLLSTTSLWKDKVDEQDELAQFCCKKGEQELALSPKQDPPLKESSIIQRMDKKVCNTHITSKERDQTQSYFVTNDKSTPLASLLAKRISKNSLQIKKLIQVADFNRRKSSFSDKLLITRQVDRKGISFGTRITCAQINQENQTNQSLLSTTSLWKDKVDPLDRQVEEQGGLFKHSPFLSTTNHRRIPGNTLSSCGSQAENFISPGRQLCLSAAKSDKVSREKKNCTVESRSESSVNRKQIILSVNPFRQGLLVTNYPAYTSPKFHDVAEIAQLSTGKLLPSTRLKEEEPGNPVRGFFVDRVDGHNIVSIVDVKKSCYLRTKKCRTGVERVGPRNSTKSSLGKSKKGCKIVETTLSIIDGVDRQLGCGKTMKLSGTKTKRKKLLPKEQQSCEHINLVSGKEAYQARTSPLKPIWVCLDIPQTIHSSLSALKTNPSTRKAKKSFLSTSRKERKPLSSPHANISTCAQLLCLPHLSTTFNNSVVDMCTATNSASKSQKASSLDQHMVITVKLPIASFPYVVQPLDCTCRSSTSPSTSPLNNHFLQNFIDKESEITEVQSRKAQGSTSIADSARKDNCNRQVKELDTNSILSTTSLIPPEMLTTPVQGNLLPLIRQSLWQESCYSMSDILCNQTTNLEDWEKLVKNILQLRLDTRQVDDRLFPQNRTMACEGLVNKRQVDDLFSSSTSRTIVPFIVPRDTLPIRTIINPQRRYRKKNSIDFSFASTSSKRQEKDLNLSPLWSITSSGDAKASNHTLPHVMHTQLRCVSPSSHKANNSLTPGIQIHSEVATFNGIFLVVRQVERQGEKVDKVDGDIKDNFIVDRVDGQKNGLAVHLSQQSLPRGSTHSDLRFRQVDSFDEVDAKQVDSFDEVDAKQVDSEAGLRDRRVDSFDEVDAKQVDSFDEVDAKGKTSRQQSYLGTGHPVVEGENFDKSMEKRCAASLDHSSSVTSVKSANERKDPNSIVVLRSARQSLRFRKDQSQKTTNNYLSSYSPSALRLHNEVDLRDRFDEVDAKQKLGCFYLLRRVEEYSLEKFTLNHWMRHRRTMLKNITSLSFLTNRSNFSQKYQATPFERDTSFKFLAKRSTSADSKALPPMDRKSVLLSTRPSPCDFSTTKFTYGIAKRRFDKSMDNMVEKSVKNSLAFMSTPLTIHGKVNLTNKFWTANKKIIEFSGPICLGWFSCSFDKSKENATFARYPYSDLAEGKHFLSSPTYGIVEPEESFLGYPHIPVERQVDSAASSEASSPSDGDNDVVDKSGRQSIPRDQVGSTLSKTQVTEVVDNKNMVSTVLPVELPERCSHENEGVKNKGVTVNAIFPVEGQDGVTLSTSSNPWKGQNIIDKVDGDINDNFIGDRILNRVHGQEVKGCNSEIGTHITASHDSLSGNGVNWKEKKVLGIPTPTPFFSNSDQVSFAILAQCTSTTISDDSELRKSPLPRKPLWFDKSKEQVESCVHRVGSEKVHGTFDEKVPDKEPRETSDYVDKTFLNCAEGYKPPFPGQLMAYGENIDHNLATTESGQILYMDSKAITLRRAQIVLIYSQAIIAVPSGEWIEKGRPLMALSYQKLVTGDIVQGLPKIEQFFEAPLLKEGSFWSDSLQAKLNQFFQEHREQLPLAEAVRKGFSEIQRVLVEGVQRVYISQGVLIADKHLEVIVRQMTSKGRILYSGDTGFLRNELVSLDKIESVNQVTYGQKALYHPQVRGITDASLESESFLSAASFQETTRVLSRDAVIGKTDLMRGLKERVIVGELIQAGTGLANNTVYHLLPS